MNIPLSAYNARPKNSRQVARTFVPPEQFWRLIQAENTVLLGPRGSGKTTLLKMLQPQALEEWDHPRAPEVRETIPFVGIFVATDRTWKEQLRLVQDEEMWRTLSDSAFCVHLIRAAVETMRFLSSESRDIPAPIPRLQLPQSTHSELAIHLAELLHLPLRVATLSGLLQQLSVRHNEIGLLRSTASRLDSLPEYTHLRPLDTAQNALDIYEVAVSQLPNYTGQQYAFLFDELELAPGHTVDDLLRALRGTQERFIQKMSLSPVQSASAEVYLTQESAAGQDYELITLTHARQKEGLDFTRDFIKSQIASHLKDEVSDTALLGRSFFSSEGSGRSYAGDSLIAGRFRNLARIDDTFAAWAVRKGIDVDDLNSSEGRDRAATVRKVRNLVVVREALLTGRAEGQQVRSRKQNSHEVYTGAYAISLLTDSNPRLMQAMWNSILDEVRDAGARPIGRPTQSRAIDSVLERFITLIRSYPPDEGAVTTSDSPVLDVLDKIGFALRGRVLARPFTDNVPSHFHVDGRTSAPLRAALKSAINAGALIHVPRTGKRIVTETLIGEEFRLSYILAPRYGLPLRLAHPVSLSSLLARSTSHQASSLFSLEEDHS